MDLSSAGIDVIVHHGAKGTRTDFAERAMVMVWNPSPTTAFHGSPTVPLYYAGLIHGTAAAAAAAAAGVEAEGGGEVPTVGRRDCDTGT